MIEINRLRDNSNEIIERLSIKNFDSKKIITEILELDKQKREIQVSSDGLLSQRNSISKEIGNLFKSGQAELANKKKKETVSLNTDIQELKEKFNVVDEKLTDLLYLLPNTPHIDVPKGKTPEENITIFEKGDIKKLHDKAKPHWELASEFDLIDFDLGVKITGAGFPVYKGKGAKLQRALINFFLDEAENSGYNEVIPPLLVNEASGYGTGQLPDKEGQMYHSTEDNFYLIPTAEVPVTNIFRDVIVKKEDFPQKLTAYTPCFRREAGSYGKDVRGLNRLHQFDKVEIVQVQHPDKSYEALDGMIEHVKGLLEKLELPYRILKLCGGDLGFTAAITYDFEVYSIAQERWLEVSSVSNFETYQANRLKLRFKNEEGKTQLAHTLNGSALALPRIVAALLENNQTENGIEIPKVLVPYTRFETI
ncbi:serine--tRNA ligase [Flavobacteriales bacterium]|jgi:seryl-tRNA synthetase|nr:serine--tRNA ligase [Flavobacteriales bacterium]MDB9932591.1 serine--tRNA ligase [Flavobacteriales bacterium]|tara:strand:- start:2483 stop:3751 length:1269 start_codon:yes stop_codon:yes gene_type:complete